MLGIIRIEERRSLRNITLAYKKHCLHSEAEERKQLMFTTVETKLARIAQMSKERPKEGFTSVYHLIDEELLMICHKELKANKASGIDGVTKADYEVNLNENIRNLTSKVQSMKYIPAPAKRVYIPKINGKMRGLAIIYEKLATEKTNK